MENTPKDLQTYGDVTLAKLIDYLKLSQSGKSKILTQDRPLQICEDLNVTKLLKSGFQSVEDLSVFLERYLQHSQHMHHPHYMGHQVAVPHVASGLADLIHGVINNPMGIYEMGPSAATLERVMINWLLDKIGWLQSDDVSCMDTLANGGGGVLTHGGSLANLTALLAARAHADPDCWTNGMNTELLILAPAVSHYCIARSASMMGLGSKSIRPIPVTANEVLKPDALFKAYKQIQSDDKKVMAVVANACATSTGLYDPLEEVGLFCNENKLWFHVDGAHGASALVSSQHEGLMKGIALADSMIWDAHKMLRTSALCAAVLFKDRKHMHKTFNQEGSYLFFEKEEIGFDLLGHSVECTKTALGTKLFMVLAAEGEQGIESYIDKTYALAMAFYEIVEAHPDFEPLCVPDSNIFCFRYRHDKGSEMQLKIRNELVKRGDYYITTAVVNGQRYLRVSLMNDLTTTNDLDSLLETLVDIGTLITNTKS